MRSVFARRVAVLWVVCGLWATEGFAQELTPRAYWPSPKGTKVAVVGYAYSSGDVLFDPSIPLYGVDSRINTAVLAYLQTLSLWGRTANVLVELPYSWGTTKGVLLTDPARRSYSGLGDLSVMLAVNLLGAPSMTSEGFAELRADPHSILGASLKVVAPTGSYDSSRLINVAANRWAVKAELGYILPLKRKWLLEVDGSIWFFGDDDGFLQGKRQQEPIASLQVHFVKRFNPGFWTSLDLNYYAGGRQTIGGNTLGDVQRNSRVGGMIAVPFRGRHAIKVGYSTGVVTSFGTDFDQFLLSYQVLFK